MCNVNGATVRAECARVEMHGTGAVGVVDDKEYTNTEIRMAIDEYIHSERDRNILKRRMIDGICYEPLAEEFCLSVPQIKRIIYKGQEIIFTKI